MVDCDLPISQFTSRISELNGDKLRVENQLQDLSAPRTTIALHPTAQARYLSLVENLAKAIRNEGSANQTADALRELIETVVVEKTLPTEPIRLRVNGRLAALIQKPTFPESSLSGVKMVAGEGITSIGN